jgi:hypothetical protein
MWKLFIEATNNTLTLMTDLKKNKRKIRLGSYHINHSLPRRRSMVAFGIP